MSATIRRRARKPRICDRCDYPQESRLLSSAAIQPGDVYLMHTLFPGEEPFYADGFSKSAECSKCAVMCGRGDLLAVTA